MTTAQKRIQDAALRLFAEHGVTQLSIRELAEAAGVARGTVYNNFKTIESLFEDVAASLTLEMSARIEASMTHTTDEAQRVAHGVRFFVRRAAEEPQWGRFLVRFCVNTPTLQAVMTSSLLSSLKSGADAGRFRLQPEQMTTALAVISGGVLAVMALVLEGHRTWRDAGAEAAELSLRTLGVSIDDARLLARGELPQLMSA